MVPASGSFLASLSLPSRSERFQRRQLELAEHLLVQPFEVGHLDAPVRGLDRLHGPSADVLARGGRQVVRDTVDAACSSGGQRCSNVSREDPNAKRRGSGPGRAQLGRGSLIDLTTDHGHAVLNARLLDRDQSLQNVHPEPERRQPADSTITACQSRVLSN
jgi:hypothetical protein